MSNVDSGRLMAHIDEAKSWLDKAKEEYCESNSIRGDLHLNLAQAEVKCAWELSRHLDVSKVEGIGRIESKPKRQRYVLPAAAVLITALIFGVVASRQWSPLPGIKNNTIANRPNEIKTVKPLQTIPVKQSVEIETQGSKSLNGQVAVSPSVPIGSVKPVVKVFKTEKPTETPVNDRQVSPVNVQRTTETAENATVASSAMGNGRTEGNSNSTKLQPVSSITIDEEALTKEASKSLRLGK